MYLRHGCLVERSKQCWSWPSDYIYMPLSSCQILFSHPEPKLLQLNPRRAWILHITLVGSYSLLPDERVSSYEGWYEVQGPQGGDSGLEFSRRRKEQMSFFFSTFLSLSHTNFFFFSLSQELMITQQTTQFKLCTEDYITTMYPAWGQFLLPKNVTNPDILECILWEWVW